MKSLLSTITRGRSFGPPRIWLYGLEGIGKSTFAASCPSPVFVQTEDGLRQIDCAKFPLAETSEEAISYLRALATEKNDFRTVVVDSLDWLERLFWAKVCREHQVDQIEKIGYGKGYSYAMTQWHETLNLLQTLNSQGKMILLLGHAVAEEYSDPEVSGYKRFAPRLHKLPRAMLTEYVDCIFLATRQFGAAAGDVNNPRVLRAEPSPTQVAKTRYQLPDTLPLDASAVLTAIQQAQQQN